MEGGSARGASLASKRAAGSSRPEAVARYDNFSVPTVGRNCNPRMIGARRCRGVVWRGGAGGPGGKPSGRSCSFMKYLSSLIAQVDVQGVNLYAIFEAAYRVESRTPAAGR